MYRQMTNPIRGGSQVEEGALRGADEISHEGREVHPHEADERTEVEQLGTQLIAHGERTDKCQPSHEEDVVAGDLRSGIERAEEAAGDGIVPAHPVEQPARGEMRAGARADRGDQERQVDREEQGGPAGLARDEDERGVDVGKALVAGPDQLRGVDLRWRPGPRSRDRSERSPAGCCGGDRGPLPRGSRCRRSRCT